MTQLCTLPDGLIGYSGFVGGNLVQQAHFDELYNSGNFRTLAGRRFRRLVCCGVSGVKWQANKDPVADMAAIRRLAEVLEHVEAEQFILVSTVDVYPDPRGVDEVSRIDPEAGQAYGRHRLWLENFAWDVAYPQNFRSILILRLPGLFGPGLRKNVIFDMLQGRDVSGVPADSSFQWYDTRRIAADTEVALNSGLKLLNLAVEPVATGLIQKRFFPEARLGPARGQGPAYDMRSRHGFRFGSRGDYLQSAEDCLAGMADWLGSPSGQELRS